MTLVLFASVQYHQSKKSMHYTDSYCTMLRRAQLCTISCHSVCLSVTLRYVFHTGCNTSKTISRPNS